MDASTTFKFCSTLKLSTKIMKTNVTVSIPKLSVIFDIHQTKCNVIS